MSEEKKNGSTSNSYNQPPPLFVRLDGRLIRSRVPLTYYDGSFKLSSYLQHSSTSFKRLDFSSKTRPAGEKERFVFFPFLLSPFSCAALDKNIQGSNVSWQPLWYIEGEWKQGSPALVRDTDGVKQKWQQLSKDCRRTGSKERIGGGGGGGRRERNITLATFDALKWPEEPRPVCLELRGEENHWLFRRRLFYVPRVIFFFFFFKYLNLWFFFEGKQVFSCHISPSASADVWSFWCSCRQIKLRLMTSWDKLIFSSNGCCLFIRLRF